CLRRRSRSSHSSRRQRQRPPAEQPAGGASNDCPSGVLPAPWLLSPGLPRNIRGPREVLGMISRRVPGFAPSTNGLHFANDFAGEPLFRLGPGGVSIPIGNAANGLCGGVIFAVRDLFAYGRSPPADRTPPRRSTALVGHLPGRLFSSFDLPIGPLRYWLWQLLPAGHRIRLRGIAWRTIR